MAKVSLRNINKKFGEVTAVDNLTLEVKDKEFLALLGPTGCGKTTVLRCIAGLENPDDGEIYIEDRLVNDVSPKDREVAMVFQIYALYPHMNVHDNIAFPLRAKKMSDRDVDTRVKEITCLLQIENLLHRKPTELSGGQRQLVAIGRAIVRKPKVFLMDEPLSNVDAKLRVYMRTELKKLQQDLGVTTVYVTHDQVEAMSLGDRLALMKQGKLHQCATPVEIYSTPSDLFVAGFIGSPPMNFIECSFDGVNLLDAGDFKLKLKNELAEIVREKAKGANLILGVRPEDMSINLKPAENSYEAVVYLVEYLGTETIVNVKLGEKSLKISVRDIKLPVKQGDKLRLTLNQNKIHIFDGKTEEALI